MGGVHPGGGERLNNATLSLYYPGVTTTPSHPKYQNNNINNTQMKMLENFLTESYSPNTIQTRNKWLAKHKLLRL